MPERITEGEGYKRQQSFTTIGGLADESGDIQVDTKEYIVQRFTRKGEALVKINDVSITSESASEGDVGGPSPTDATLAGAMATTESPTHVDNTMNELSTDLEGDLRVRVDAAQAARDAVVVDDVIQVGGISRTAAPTYTTDRANALSLTTGGALRTRIDTAQAAHDAAAPADTVLVGARANAVADTPDEGDAAQLSVDLNNQLRTRIDLAQAAPAATAPTQMVIEGGVAETTFPTAVTDGQTVRPLRDEYGRAIGRTDDLGSNATLTACVAALPRAYTGPFTFTQIDEPGETAATNISGYPEWCFQVDVGGTPLASTIEAMGSIDGTDYGTITTETTAQDGLAVALNVGTISKAGTYFWKGRCAMRFIKLRVMGDSGSPDSATFDIALFANA